MRRAPLVLVATAAGLTGVLTFHPRRPSNSAVTTTPTSNPTGSSSTTTPAGGAAAGPAAPAPAAGPGSASKGKVVQYGYGELGALVTVSGKKITDVSVPTLLTADSYSQQIAQYVIPMLRHEVLAAQSSKVQTIAGATYTSMAYLDSVQSALDHLHA